MSETKPLIAGSKEDEAEQFRRLKAYQPYVSVASFASSSSSLIDRPSSRWWCYDLSLFVVLATDPYPAILAAG
jgi:hypothetical protein